MKMYDNLSEALSELFGKKIDARDPYCGPLDIVRHVYAQEGCDVLQCAYLGRNMWRMRTDLLMESHLVWPGGKQWGVAHSVGGPVSLDDEQDYTTWMRYIAIKRV